MKIVGHKVSEISSEVKAAAFLMLLLTVGLGYFAKQSGFYPLIGMYASFWAIYVWSIIRIKRKEDLQFLIWSGILFRGILVFSFPNLSDDIYRFIWDGHLAINGHNPFNFLPLEIIEGDEVFPGLTSALFAELNSQEYYTVYPPIAQITFATAVFLFPSSWWGCAIIMKFFLFAFEIGSIVLLQKLLREFKMPAKNVLWYVLNPLILLEITGNLHFEGGMIFFLLLGFWWLVRGRLFPAAVALACSIAAKLLPLLFLPFLIKRLGWKISIGFFTVVGLTLVLLFSPLFNEVFLQNFSSSLDLYFRNFEFNGSIYYFIRWIGFQVKGYNIIAKVGPKLAMVVFFLIVSKAILNKDKSWEGWPSDMLFAICVYLFLGTTIHPWYVSLPIVLSVFTSFRFPILWSGLIMYTYINYSYEVYSENLWVVGLEYGFLFAFLIYELITKQLKKPLQSEMLPT